jgi:adenylate cyclase
MQLAVADLNKEYHEAGFPEVEIGIGINTGEVVVGNIGSLKRAKYGVVGRNVNVVSRIESYTVGNQILISESTKKHIQPGVTIRKTIKVNPKGVREPIKLFDLRGIGKPYDLLLPDFEDELKELDEKVEVQYVVLDEKAADQITQEGVMTHLSENRACVKLAEEIPLYSNLKLYLSGIHQDLQQDVIYAKAVEMNEENGGSITIHFTHIPQRVKKFLANGTLP